MKDYGAKKFWQKAIIIIAVIITLFNVILPTASKAAGDDMDVYGALFSPIQSFLVGLGDVVMWVTNSANGGGYPIVVLKENWLDGEKISFGKVLAWGNPVGLAYLSSAYAAHYVGVDFPGVDFPDRLEIPNFAVSPELIFANQIPLLNVNFFNVAEGSTVQKLQGTIASWYLTFRNFAAVGLLSVLVYIAIRILISSTATDKAKYKTMIKDWLVAICLLFFMHYIMSFAVTMVDSVTASLAGNMQYITVGNLTYSNLNKYSNASDVQNKMEPDGDKIQLTFTEYIRFKAQTTDEGAQSGIEKFGYTVMYLVMVIYTVMFLFVYVKRLVYIILLTLMAPLVCLSYPLDKIKDGSAQGFNTWLREYIFNLLIQPLHLILYYVLIGSAMDLVRENIVYPVIVIGLLLPVEKLLRKLFGFDKSATASSLFNGVIGGAAAMKGIEFLGRKLRGGSAGGKGKAEGGNEDAGKINTARKADKEYKDKTATGYMGLESGLPDDEHSSTSSSSGQTGTEGENGDIELDETGLQWQDYIDNAEEPINAPNTPVVATRGGTTGSQKDSDEESEIENPDYGINFVNDSPISDKIGFNDDVPLSYEDYAEGMRIKGKENKILSEEDYYKQQKRKIAKNKQKEEMRKLRLARREGEKAKRKYVWKNFLDKDNNIKSLKKVGKGIGKIYGAATLGTMGVAAGLASDKFSNILTYGAAAGAIGAGVGGSVAEKAMNAHSEMARRNREANEEYLKGSMSKEAYQDFINKKLDKEFLKNKEEIEKYRDAFKDKGKVKIKDEKGKEKEVEAYKVAMQKAIEYRKAGVTDSDIIIKAMKAKSAYASDDLADQRRIYAAKLAPHGKTEEGIEHIGNRMRKQGVKSEKQIQDQQEMIRQITGMNY